MYRQNKHGRQQCLITATLADKSFLSANAEEEIGGASFEQVQAQAQALWNEKLSKIEIDVENTPANVTGKQEYMFCSIVRAYQAT